MKLVLAALALAGTAASALAGGPVVFQNTWDNGFFTPFNSSTPTSIRYGDSGWFGSGGDAPAALCEITLGLVVFNSTAAGTTDLTFTFNNGDPSGMVFGNGATLYSTTVTNVTLPDASEVGGVAPIFVTIPLPGVSTTGGFNNIGWSLGVQNFSSNGSLGFQCSSGFAQPAGFYTNNASYFDGSSWSLFSFGSNPISGVANFVTTLTVPAPGAVSLLGVAALGLRRRR